jgi:hypothetical protein
MCPSWAHVWTVDYKRLVSSHDKRFATACTNIDAAKLKLRLCACGLHNAAVAGGETKLLIACKLWLFQFQLLDGGPFLLY